MPPPLTNRFRASLPGDPNEEPRPRQVHGALWSSVQPTPVRAPYLLAHAAPLAAELGLSHWFADPQATAAVLCGNRPWRGSAPYAANYGGHQFGHWAGQLGDGRAIVLGELPLADGSHREIQLKGAGPTPYSRAGDGRAVLRSSLREFLCSEAMHWLGVPTTRALAVCATGEDVIRDMFYDGRPAAEPGAIVCRVAPSFLRFGSFELPAVRGDAALLQQLARHTITEHYRELCPTGSPDAATYAAWFRTVAERTATLIAHWQTIGFVHGVLNTDNLSILGLTIDYGPYGWLEEFDLAWTPNTTDASQRRYCYGNQPGIGFWNLENLGAALLPLFDGDEDAVHQGLDRYREVYATSVTRRFGQKLGIIFRTAAGDDALLEDLFALLRAERTDLTLFFRALGDVVVAPSAPGTLPSALADAHYLPPSPTRSAALVTWLQRWWQRTRDEPTTPAAQAQAMAAVNPWLVLRNWVAHEVVEATTAGDLGPLRTLLAALERPFTVQPTAAKWVQKRPRWADDKPGCSALSCSS